jgi:hypothetical protein
MVNVEGLTGSGLASDMAKVTPSDWQSKYASD